MEQIKKKKDISIDAVIDGNQHRKNLSARDMLTLFGKVKKRENGSLFVSADDCEDEEAEEGADAEEESQDEDEGYNDDE